MLKMTLYLKLSLAGAIICVTGATFGWGIIPAYIRKKIGQYKGLEPGSESRKIWEKLPFPMTFKVYLFNVTNRQDVNMGHMPILKEIGPYVFDEWREKVLIVDDEENDTVSYFHKTKWIFDKEKSWPLTGDELFVIPHPAMLGILLTTEKESSAFLGIVAKAIVNLFNDPQDVFLETTAMDFLFDGHYINCSGSDFPTKAVCGTIRKRNIFAQSDEDENLFKFSIFGSRNNSNGASEVRVSRGTKDPQMVGQMISYKGLGEQTVWKGMPCNAISGTDGTVFPPFLDRADIHIFSTELCRSMVLKYVEDSSYKLVPTLRTRAGLGDMSSNENDRCFCINNKKPCLKKGVMDLSKCQGAPLIASLPHFYDAHEDYQNGVLGLAPSDDKHSITVNFEPLTGTPLSSHTRIQFSLQLHQIAKINMTTNLSDIIVPFIWIEESLEMSDVLVDTLKTRILNTINGFAIGRWVTTAGGAGVSILSAGVNYLNPFRTSDKLIIPVV